MVVRITRLMEYEYTSVEQALADMERWAVPPNGTQAWNRGAIPPMHVVRSAVIGPVFGETAEQIADMTAVPGNLDEDGQREDPSIERAEEMRQELAVHLGVEPISADAVWEELLTRIAEMPGKTVVEDLVRRARDMVTALDDYGLAYDVHGSEITLYRDRLRHWLQTYVDGTPAHMVTQATGSEEYGPDWLIRRVAVEWTAMNPNQRTAVRGISNDLYDALGAASTWVVTHQ